ncbi:hypothetical protein DFP93_101329 [Aneurinibacillus soli]|uniref:Uncharacterized protein n=1 Tax=Aneurinibacillus soli TaxID=1500254 RepID=A0A0U5BBG6_9BACL|nr:hypothetical protein [Aneurinibacillus soli]PYE64303.1 hypothetical protein DFP93_101329 [Aneurinibacillus soli]BAU28252.1 hypothetical protein CB4_02426 [Aneurinibacillus soli]
MKKVIAMMLAVAVMFGAGGFVAVDHADAKGYKSGKSSFQPSKSSTPQTPAYSNQSQFKNSTNTSTPTKNTAPAATPSKGGFMKGLIAGGLAGLLLGGLIGNMGTLGSILGLLVNVLAIVLIIGIVRKLYTAYKERKREKEANAWRP